MPKHPKASPDAIELTTVLGAVRRKLLPISILAVAAGAVTFLVLSAVAPVYQSEAELAIVARGANASFTDSKGATGGPEVISTRMDKEAINTHVRALQSPALIARIAEDLKLSARPEFNTAIGPVDTIDGLWRLAGLGGPRPGESEQDRVLNAFRERLQVYSAKESRFIGVRFSSIDPELAAQAANGISDAYRASLASQGVSEIDEQQSVLKSKIDKLVPEVAAAETEIERYRGEINVFKGGAQNTGLNEQQLSELTAELTKAQTQLGEAEARARSAREMMKSGSADALPDVQRSPLIQSLVQQRVRIERQISELSAILLPAHPRMRQLNADLAGLKKQLSAEIGKLVESLDKEAAVSRDRVANIKNSLDELKKRVVNIAPQEARLRQLEANVKAKRNELENLQAQIEANRKKLDSRTQPVEAQLISKAQAASVPVYPKKAGLSALVATAIMLLGLAWTITGALFNAARSSGEAKSPLAEMVQTRAEPALPDAPKQTMPAPAVSAPTVATEIPPSVAAIAPRIAAARSQAGGHRTLITGETAAVDPSAEALSLVAALTEGGAQIILIEWDRAGRGVLDTRMIEGNPGLNALVTGEAGFEEIVNRLPGSSAHLIRCGTALHEDASDVDADHMNMILDALDEAYDHIVVVANYGEARYLFEKILGRFDAGVLVCEPRRRASVLEDAENSFLGFEVADIDVIRLERPAPPVEPKAAAPFGRSTRQVRKVPVLSASS